MASVDSTARVADGARLADDVEVGPYCVVGPQVELRSGVRLISHVSVSGVTVIGARTVDLPVRFARHATAIDRLSRRRHAADGRTKTVKSAKA